MLPLSNAALFLFRRKDNIFLHSKAEIKINFIVYSKNQSYNRVKVKALIL